LVYTIESRGRRADLIALLGIAVAVLARTQFAALLVVLPIALLVHELLFVERETKPWRARVRRGATRSVSEHRLLAVFYVPTVAVVALVFEVSSFDVRFGGATVHDRYLFYVVPLFLIAFAAALSERSWPRWSLIVPTALLVAAYVHVPLPRFEKLNVDTPVA